MLGMTAQPDDQQKIFRPSREHIVGVILMVGIALIGISWAPLMLGWLLLFPLGWIAWVLCASTTVDERGISLRYVARPNTRIEWDDLEGIGFKGARALATTKGGKEYMMPGVSFNSLPDLAEASRGRITDVITGAQEAADGKYEIIDKDNHHVLLSREEYEEYLQEHPDTPGPRPTTDNQ